MARKKKPPKQTTIFDVLGHNIEVYALGTPATEVALSAAVAPAVEKRMREADRLAKPADLFRPGGTPPGLNEVLHRALHSIEGAGMRWDVARLGCTDAELRERIAAELGSVGGMSGPDGPTVCWVGGKAPSIAVGDARPLRGKALLAKVRALLAIPDRDGA